MPSAAGMPNRTNNTQPRPLAVSTTSPQRPRAVYEISGIAPNATAITNQASKE